MEGWDSLMRRHRREFISLVVEHVPLIAFADAALSFSRTNRPNESSAFGTTSMSSSHSPYGWHRMSGSVDQSHGGHGGAPGPGGIASDDVEEEMNGMEVAAFGTVPRQQLRVTNPEE